MAEAHLDLLATMVVLELMEKPPPYPIGWHHYLRQGVRGVQEGVLRVLVYLHPLQEILEDVVETELRAICTSETIDILPETEVQEVHTVHQPLQRLGLLENQ